MAKLDTAQMRDLLAPVLPAGETLQHAAYGVRQPNILLMLPAFALAILPGVILTQMLTRHYVVGQSRNYLMVAEISPKWRSMMTAVDAVRDRWAVSINTLRGQPKTVRSGPVFTHIAFGTGQDGFKAKFHRMFSRTNRAEAEAIGAVVKAATDRRMRARH
ncbi:MAG: hypothetical protein H6898_06750 [Rhodobacter sp.]|nr:hypothetical protein [Paracoccaceae bacterium]MCC0076273.1 hypothetical protein [Rhodobacter sp.]